MIYLLDTNICIYTINAKPAQVSARFRQHDMRNIAISSITAAELCFGVSKSNSARNTLALEQFFAPLTIMPFDTQCIWHYGRLRAALAEQGKLIGSLDMLIAAHALALDAVLVTNNVREFERVEGLRLENWV